MRRVAIALGLVLPSLDLVSDAFVFRAPTPKAATSVGCREHAAVVAAGAGGESTSRLQAHIGNSCGREWQAAGFSRQRYQGQVWRLLVYQHV